MDHQDTSAQAGDNTLSMISDIRGSAESSPATETPTAQEAAKPAETTTETKEAAAEVVSQDDEQAAEARRNALLREIAIDPNLTSQYVQQQYYPQQAQQTQQYQPQPQQAQGPQLPFDEFSYDPGNPEHQKALIAHQLQEVGGPLFEAIQQITQRHQQDEAARQQQQAQHIAEQANQKTVDFLDTYVQGFKGIADKLTKGEGLSSVERAVFNEAVNAESALVQNFALQLLQQNPGVDYQQAYQYVLHNTQMRAQIAQHIGPELKKYANELGLVAQPGKPQLTPEQQAVMKRESYVESSNAVPANTAGSFDKAHQSGDSLGMIRALRAK